MLFLSLWLCYVIFKNTNKLALFTEICLFLEIRFVSWTNQFINRSTCFLKIGDFSSNMFTVDVSDDSETVARREGAEGRGRGDNTMTNNI